MKRLRCVWEVVPFAVIQHCGVCSGFLPISRDAEVRETAVLAVRRQENDRNEVISHISNNLGRISIPALLNGDDDNALESIPKDHLALTNVNDLNASTYAVSDNDGEGFGSETVSI